MPDDVVAALHVFVYGTLRRGGSNDIARYGPAPELIGYGSIAGTLYDLGAYPGAVLSGVVADGERGAVPGARIHGEIYRITDAVEAALDVLEEVRDDGAGEYIKRYLEVALKVRTGTQTLRCLVYEIHPSRIAGRIVIESGDWFRR
ncbi:MAG: hypothetical protein JWQ73_3042 [Variovorax sp.]|nr:hypothetical protein [Variovorax sp.]